MGGASPDTAVVFACVDQHTTDSVKADGTSSGDDLQHNYSYMAILGRSSSGSWMVVSDERVWVWTSAEGRVMEIKTIRYCIPYYIY